MVGAGGISRHHRAAFLAAPELARLVTICDAREAVARDFAAQFPEPVNVVGDHHQLLNRNLFDAAIVALPHNLHFPIARDFVEAGIPVLVEKPLTCTLDETRELRELSVRYGVPVVAGQMRRFNREAVWLRRWLEASPQTFGELRSFDIHSWQNILGYFRGILGLPEGADHWLLDGKRAGGGVVISLAVHQLDLVRFVTGLDYTEVMAHGRFDAPFYNGAESTALVLLRLENQAAGTLHANYLTTRTPYNEAMHLMGEHGAVIQHADHVGQYHGPLRFASDGGHPTTAWADMYEGFSEVPAEEIAELHEDPFVNQLVSFVQSLRAGVEPANSVHQNFNTMACIEAIHQSLKSGQPVQVARK
jgi:predicted dehydrogenase